MIDAVASDYQDTIKFVAVAGRSDELPTEERVAELLTDNVAWPSNDYVWNLCEIRVSLHRVTISSLTAGTEC